MFFLAAEQRIQADGIRTEGQREKREMVHDLTKYGGGVKNQLNLFDWLARTHTIKEVEEMTSHLEKEYYQHRCLRRVCGNEL